MAAADGEITGVTFHDMNGHIVLIGPGDRVDAVKGSIWDAVAIATEAGLSLAAVTDRLIQWKLMDTPDL